MADDAPAWMAAVREWMDVLKYPLGLVSGAGAWGGVRWWVERGDAKRKAATDNAATERNKEADRLVAERASLSADQREAFERIEADLKDARAEAKAERTARLEIQREMDALWVRERRGTNGRDGL